MTAAVAIGAPVWGLGAVHPQASEALADLLAAGEGAVVPVELLFAIPATRPQVRVLGWQATLVPAACR